MADQDTGGVDCLLQGDLEQVSLRRSEELVEGVSREGVVLRAQRENSVFHRSGTDRFGPGLRSVLLRTCGTCKPFLANTPESAIRLTDTRAPSGAWPACTGREAGGVITSETSETVRTDTREGQAVVCTVATV